MPRSGPLRTFKEERREDNANAWLRRAGESGRTFYGLLARRMLGVSLRPEPSISSLTLGEADVEAVDATESGHRAFALLQVGQDARAATELQLLWSQTRDKEGFSRSIMLVARQAGLNTLANQFARLFEPAPVHLPDRRLRPKGGFQTDPALIYALARLESNFDPEAVSRAGARGLMQLMPSTVDFITGSSFPPRLHDPSVSLELGQRYLTMLAQYDVIGGDLIRLARQLQFRPGQSRQVDRRHPPQRRSVVVHRVRAERGNPRLHPARARLYVAVCRRPAVAVAEPGRLIDGVLAPLPQRRFQRSRRALAVTLRRQLGRTI